MLRQKNLIDFWVWKRIPATSWKKPSAPGRKSKLEKQRLGMFPGKYRKTKKLATNNGMLFNLLTLYAIHIIHEMNGIIAHWKKFLTAVAQLNSNRKSILHMHMKSYWYQPNFSVTLTLYHLILFYCYNRKLNMCTG